MRADEPSLAGKLLLARDAERTRIAKQLHSGVGQQIAALSLIASNLKRRASAVNTELAAQFDTLHSKLGEIAAELQGLSRQLHPSLLEHSGIVAALHAYCSSVSATTGFPVEFDAESVFDDLAEEDAMCLYRVAEGALKSITGRASVKLRAVEDGVELDVSAPIGENIELAIIRERAQLAGAEAYVRCGPAGRVRFTWRGGREDRNNVP